MKENISVKTVCGFYAAANMYGLDSVMKKSVSVLLFCDSVMNHFFFFFFLPTWHYDPSVCALQVFGVASQQPDDSSKRGPDEGAGVSVRLFNSHIATLMKYSPCLTFLRL